MSESLRPRRDGAGDGAGADAAGPDSEERSGSSDDQVERDQLESADDTVGRIDLAPGPAPADASRSNRSLRTLIFLGLILTAATGLARAVGFSTGALYVALTILIVLVATVLAVLEHTIDRPGRHRAVAVASVLGASTGLLALLWLFRPPGDPLPELSGDLNIAVAEFGHEAGDEDIERAARSLSRSLHGFLVDEAATFRSEDTLIEFLGPDEVGVIAGDSRAERAERALDLAEESNSDVVLYGTLRFDGVHSALEPEFVLNDQRLAGALELTGHHALGTPIEALGQPLDAQRALRGDTRARIVALARFMVGLSFYRVDELSQARSQFERVRRDEAWRDEDGKELVYLFLGNVESKLGEYDVAADEYETALLLNPQFARAMIGEAELLYLQGLGEAGAEPGGEICSPTTIDRVGLDQAAERYEDAASAVEQPAIADVDLKAAYGIGRVELCRYLAGDWDRADAASELFDQVIDGYEAGRASVRTLASESYAHTALLASSDPQQTGAPLAVACEVVRRYGKAIELSVLPERRDLFATNMAPSRELLDGAGHSCTEQDEP